MKVRTVTKEQVLNWEPCSKYKMTDINSMFGTRSVLSAKDITALSIPDIDKIWALCHIEFFDSKADFITMACDIFKTCYTRFKNRHTAGSEVLDAVTACTNYLEGNIEKSELLTANAKLFNSAKTPIPITYTARAIVVATLTTEPLTVNVPMLPVTLGIEFARAMVQTKKGTMSDAWITEALVMIVKKQ